MVSIDVLLPSTSQYNVLNHFTLKLYEAFIRQGTKCRLLSGDERIYATLSNPPDFTIGFNGALKMEDGTFFCDHINVPHVSCLVDPPFRFLELIKSPNIIISCDDQEGCALLKARGFDRAIFMPHAVEPELAPDSTVDRIYEISFLGTCIDPTKQKEQWGKKFSAKTLHFMEEAASVCLENNKISFMTVLLKYFDPAKDQQVFEAVEIYVKGVDRLKLLHSFPDCQIHVFGAGLEGEEWKKILKNEVNFIVHSPVSYLQALEIMKQSKIVLNSSIKNKRGAHERVFTAAACGAVVITNDNSWMREQFRDEKELILYNNQDLTKCSKLVKSLLENEDKRRSIAEEGRKHVMAGHTWDHRVRHLLTSFGL